MRYQVQIRAANVPDALAGAPLSVELISQAGNARRVLLPLSAAPVIEDVDGPGTYLIRATLPSGRLISNTVTTPETPNPEGDALGTAVLDLQEQDAITDFWREAESLLKIAVAVQASGAASGAKDQPLPTWIVDATQDLAKRAWGGITASIMSGTDRLRELVGRPSTEATRGDTAQPAMPELKAGPLSVPDTGVGAGASSVRKIVRVLERMGRISAVVTRGDTSQPAGPEPKAGPLSGPGIGDGGTAPAAASYHWGTFVRWDSAPARQRRLDIPKMLLRRGGSGAVGPDGEIMPPWRQGDRFEPCFIEVAEADARSLIVWLPGPKLRPVKVVVDPDGATHRSGSPLLAFLDPVDPIATTLFSYVRQGALEEARLGLPTLVASLKRDTVLAGPNLGLLAGYVLYKLRDRFVDDVISRLLTQYLEVPDVHILAAAQLIADGKTDQAIEPLTAALGRGAPIYTEGVRLLREGSNLLRDLYPSEKRFQDNARQAACIAAAANFGSELTCLRLGDDIAMEFVDSQDSQGLGNQHPHA